MSTKLAADVQGGSERTVIWCCWGSIRPEQHPIARAARRPGSLANSRYVPRIMALAGQGPERALMLGGDAGLDFRPWRDQGQYQLAGRVESRPAERDAARAHGCLADALARLSSSAASADRAGALVSIR